MGMFSKQGWKDWARRVGLTYHAPSSWLDPRMDVGSYRGYLISWAGSADRNVSLRADPLSQGPSTR